ncbi:hypothetical protein [Bacillus massilinigeriensis]|uniref:hypothetical protein n=1 Tax=Bacillus mediterraneensis TaxID=1805474 RepID=UPI0008F908C1|nr:hypothetical protein [Bacillus mediterraneensis]
MDRDGQVKKSKQIKAQAFYRTMHRLNGENKDRNDHKTGVRIAGGIVFLWFVVLILNAIFDL